MLSERDSKLILSLARESIKSCFSNKKIDLSKYDFLKNKQGVFVTLHKNERLRGCIGFPYPSYDLKEGIFQAARAAAFEDPRFRPLSKDELKEISIEISVLSVPEEIKAAKKEEIPKKIKIGEDGLIVKKNFFSGLLLPQVFTEYNCTPEMALEMTCEKAGLPKDSWKDPSTKILKFQADILREK